MVQVEKHQSCSIKMSPNLTSRPKPDQILKILFVFIPSFLTAWQTNATNDKAYLTSGFDLQLALALLLRRMLALPHAAECGTTEADAATTNNLHRTGDTVSGDPGRKETCFSAVCKGGWSFDWRKLRLSYFLRKGLECIWRMPGSVGL